MGIIKNNYLNEKRPIMLQPIFDDLSSLSPETKY